MGGDGTVKAPINTKQLAKGHPEMEGWVLGGAPHKIEQQEAEGQRSFVGSDTLPTDRRGCDETLTAAGAVFGELVPGDPLFQYVTLPAGWKKVPTDHPPVVRARG